MHVYYVHKLYVHCRFVAEWLSVCEIKVAMMMMAFLHPIVFQGGVFYYSDRVCQILGTKEKEREVHSFSLFLFTEPMLPKKLNKNETRKILLYYVSFLFR